jgi:predicted flap endonuclease-1-like 5' DNA nuclease
MIVDQKLKLNRTSRAWFAVYDDEDKVLEATKRVYARGVNIMDCFTPHPIHGIEKAMGLKRSRLPIVAFICGTTGFSLALLMQYWMMVDDWSMIIGGKPYASVPAWVPVTFESSILLTAFGMGIVFFLRSRMLHGILPDLADERQTDNRYVIAMDVDDVSINHNELEGLIRESGAVELKERVGGVTTILAASSGSAKKVVAEEKKEEPKNVQAKSSDTEYSEEEIASRKEIITNKLGAAAASAKDDLKLISGVGPKYEEKLNAIGIYTFEQISKLDEESIKAIEDLTKHFPGRIERDDWVGQANNLMNK